MRHTSQRWPVLCLLLVFIGSNVISLLPAHAAARTEQPVATHPASAARLQLATAAVAAPSALLESTPTPTPRLTAAYPAPDSIELSSDSAAYPAPARATPQPAPTPSGNIAIIGPRSYLFLPLMLASGPEFIEIEPTPPVEPTAFVIERSCRQPASASPASATPTALPSSPENPAFDLACGTVANTLPNPDFERAPAPVDPQLFPANSNFSNGRTGWEFSWDEQWAIRDDSERDGANGAYLAIFGSEIIARSPHFTMPAQAQSLHVRYRVGLPSSMLASSAINGNVVSSRDHWLTQTRTRFTLKGDWHAGWQTGVVNLDGLAGQEVAIELQSPYNYSGLQRTLLDSLSLHEVVPGWTLNSGSTVQRVSDANNDPAAPKGSHLLLPTSDDALISSSFVVSPTVQSLHLRYLVGRLDQAEGTHTVLVSVISGTGSLAVTTTSELKGSLSSGWQTGVVDLQRFQGRRIRVMLALGSSRTITILARIDRLTLSEEVPGWTTSDMSTVFIAETKQPAPPSTDQPANAGLEARPALLPQPSLVNSDFSSAATSLGLLPNGDFSSGLTSWTTAPAAGATVLNDAQGDLGWSGQQYMLLGPSPAIATSAAFVVPPTAQTLHLRFAAPLGREWLVSIVSRATGSPITSTTTLRSNSTQWQDGMVDLQAFRGETIQISMYNDAFALRLDSLAVYRDTPGWEASDGRQVQIRRDSQSTEASNNYLDITGSEATITSPTFVVSATAQSLHFRYFIGQRTAANNEFTGTAMVLTSRDNFQTEQPYPTEIKGTFGLWRDGYLDLQRFVGQSIRVRFVNSAWSSVSSEFGIDSLAIYQDVPGWTIVPATMALSSTGGISQTYLQIQPSRLHLGAETSPFIVASSTYSLTFNYLMAGGQPNDTLLSVNVLSGEGYGTVTEMLQLQSPATAAWQLATINLSSFRGRAIKLRISNLSSSATLKLDLLRTRAGSGGPAPHSDVNTNAPALRFSSRYHTATSALFTIPADATVVRFNYLGVGDTALNPAMLEVYALINGRENDVIPLGNVTGSEVDGWKVGSLSLATAKQHGQPIKLRFNSNGAPSSHISLDLVFAGRPGAQLWTAIQSPSSVTSNTTFSFQVKYANLGDTAMDVPLFEVISRGGAPIGLSGDRVIGAGTTLHLLLQSPTAPLDKLPPGASGAITVYSYASAPLDFALTPMPLNAPIPWDSLKDEFTPPELKGTPYFDDYWNALRIQLGETGRDLRANVMALQRTMLEVNPTPSNLTDIYSIVELQAEATAQDHLEIVSLQQQESMSGGATMSAAAAGSVCPPVVSNDPGKVHFNVIGSTKVGPDNFSYTIKPDGGIPNPNKNTYIIIHGFRNSGGKDDDGDTEFDPSPTGMYLIEPWISNMAGAIKKESRTPTS